MGDNVGGSHMISAVGEARNDTACAGQSRTVGICPGIGVPRSRIHNAILLYEVDCGTSVGTCAVGVVDNRNVRFGNRYHCEVIGNLEGGGGTAIQVSTAVVRNNRTVITGGQIVGPCSVCIDRSGQRCRSKEIGAVEFIPFDQVLRRICSAVDDNGYRAVWDGRSSAGGVRINAGSSDEGVGAEVKNTELGERRGTVGVDVS